MKVSASPAEMAISIIADNGATNVCGAAALCALTGRR